jgi:ribonuclease P protein component
LIDEAFSKGAKLKGYPLIVVVHRCTLPKAVPVQLATQVSKRRFKRAVDRNRIKRLMREAWRRHKADLENELCRNGAQYAAVFIFVGKEMPTLQQLDRSTLALISKWKALQVEGK